MQYRQGHAGKAFLNVYKRLNTAAMRLIGIFLNPLAKNFGEVTPPRAPDGARV